MASQTAWNTWEEWTGFATRDAITITDIRKTASRFPNSADTIAYWKPLSETLDDYADHREAKSGRDIFQFLQQIRQL